LKDAPLPPFLPRFPPLKYVFFGGANREENGLSEISRKILKISNYPKTGFKNPRKKILKFRLYKLFVGIYIIQVLIIVVVVIINIAPKILD